MIVLAEGDRVPADAVLVMSQNMPLDESLLSGESVPVRKVASAETATAMRPPGSGADDGDVVITCRVTADPDDISGAGSLADHQTKGLVAAYFCH